MSVNTLFINGFSKTTDLMLGIDGSLASISALYYVLNGEPHLIWDPHYNGLTYVTSGSVNAQFDLYPNNDKRGYFTIVQLDGPFTATIENNNGRDGWSPTHYNNCDDIYAPSAGTYTLEVTNYTDFTSYGLEFFNDAMLNVTQLLSFDGYGKTSITCNNSNTFAGVTKLPNRAFNYNHCENLTTIDRLFRNAHLTCPIIPVIQAMLKAAPNLRVTSGNGPFTSSYCLNAPDIYDAYLLYPNWFVGEIEIPHYDFSIVPNYSDERMVLSWVLDPPTHELSEDVHYTVRIDGTTIDVGTDKQVSTEDFDVGEHTAIIYGTCSHGNVVNAPINFIVTERHRNFSVHINPFTSNDTSVTWTNIYG